jgi:TonB family protein
VNFRYSEDVNRTFKTALLFSAVLHIFLLFNWPIYRHLFTERKNPGDIEITYLKLNDIVQKPAEAPARRSLLQPEVSQPAKLVTEAKPAAEAKAPPKAEAAKKEQPRTDKEESEQVSRVVIKQPIVPQIQATASVDMQGLRLMPSSYSQSVRNRIIENLDMMKSVVEGQVCVRFVVYSDGKLKDVRIVDERSSSNGFLRSAAFDAVKGAAPFAEFPSGVNLPEITFTCEISFSRR